MRETPKRRLIDQIGGPRKIAFGKRRALDLIHARREDTPSSICDRLLAALSEWQGSQSLRDDVTLFFARV